MPSDIMRVAYLGRESGGGEQECSLAQQRSAVEKYATEQGYQLVAWYEDAARPGGKPAETRERFITMIDDALQTPRPFDAVLCWDFSRFSRSEVDRAYFVALLQRRGIAVISVTQPVPDGPVSGIIRATMAFADAEYLRQLSRNVKRGLEAAVLAGRHPGSQPPAGYIRTLHTIGTHRDGTPRTIQRWQVDEVAASKVREAFALYAVGAGMREIHAQLDLLPSFHAYRHMFANPVYIGRIRSGDLEVPAPELRIVDDATWSAVQARRAQRIPPRRVRSTHVLSGLLFCGACGRPMSGTTDTRREHSYRYYRCTSAVTLAPPTCAKRVPAAAIETPVLETVLTRLTTPATVDALLTDLQAQAAHDPRPAQARALDADIAQAEKAITLLLDLAETGTLALGEIRKRLAERESALAALRQQRAGLPVVQVAPFDAAKFRTWLAALVVELQVDDVPIARRALAQVVARIVYDPATGIEIIYRESIGV